MKIEKISKLKSQKYNQTKRFGVISEGCNGVWGDGDTVNDAIENALINMRDSITEADDKTDADLLTGCYLMELSN